MRPIDQPRRSGTRREYACRNLLVVIAVALFIAAIVVLVKRPSVTDPKRHAGRAPGSTGLRLCRNSAPANSDRRGVSHGGIDYVVRGSVRFREGPSCG